jgi:peptidoglycan/xylan/chitin deacetylase (PgdA/CDA1 family)
MPDRHMLSQAAISIREHLAPLGRALLRDGSGQQWGAGCTVLLYHRLSSTPAGRLTPLAVWVQDFEEQLKWLSRKRRLLSAASLVAGLRRGADLNDTAVITFDDDHACTYELAWPLLMKYHAPATVFVDTKRINGGGLSKAQICRMAEGDVEFGSHTVNHPDLRRLHYRQLKSELCDSLQCLKSVIDTPVCGLAYPFGRYDDVVVRAARESGYDYACTCKQHENNTAHTNPFELRRVEVTSTDTLARFVSKVNGGYAGFYRLWQYAQHLTSHVESNYGIREPS